MQSTSTAPAARHLPIRKDWLAATQEAALEPDRPIIDPHHHLWDRPGNRYLLHDLVEDLGSGHNIRATVFLECREMYRADGPPETRSLGETDVRRRRLGDERERQIRPDAGLRRASSAMSISASAAAPRASSNSTSSPRAGASAASATARPGTADPSLRVFTSGSGEGLYRRPQLARGVRRAGAAQPDLRGLDVPHPARRSDRASPRAFPETKIVLNHVGGALAVGPYADKREEVFAEWRTQIQKLGQFPNVYIKLGGLGMPSLMGFEMGQQETAPSSEQLAKAWRPYLDTCIEAFGPRPLDVREQFPGRQGDVQLCQSVERVQARLRELFERREERDVPQHRAEVLSACGDPERGRWPAHACRQAAGRPRSRDRRTRERSACHCHAKRSTRTTPKYLRDKYAIVGVGETTYTRGSGMTTRALGTWAVRNAILDAGLKPSDIDGMLDYSGGDSTSATFIAGDLGMRLNFYMDVVGGGSSTEALIGIAIGIIEAGLLQDRRDLPRR